ncbi:carboxypeptidase-like regulatory domain-containing protein [Candidatus Parcubacteria bacterium]|nr:carboxypeptidase-like regulatory domain-containing protein [Candidatus Parcubacteria bacterium]
MRSFSLRGVSLIDVVVGAALVLIVFVGLFGILRASIQVAGLSKLKATATEIATSQMEYIRSLDYASIGTAGGIPAGAIAQNASTTNGGLVYDVQTHIVYIDDPADGLGALDSNGINTDYKKARVRVSYIVSGSSHEVVLVSNFAPKGIESTAGGGTLSISVVNAVGAPVSGATVRIVNSAISPAVDTSVFSDAAGKVFLPGAPTSTDYQVFVSKSGYSSAQTYARDAINDNPTPGYFTVVADSTTSGTFAIDLLASLTLRTFSPIQPFVFFDAFGDDTNFASFTNAVVTGGVLSLSGTAGTYPPNGSALSDPVSPQYLARWTSASSTRSIPPSTDARIQIADGAGVVLSDAVLPGNSAGFTGTVNLSGVSTTTYPSLSLIALLSSTDPNISPQILDWELGYEAGPIPLPNVSFTLTGGKTIGSTALGEPLYKTIVATTTGTSAQKTLSLEWDLYQLVLSGYSLVSASLSPPFELLPSASMTSDLILTPL